nr:oxidoreductase [Micromonospora sp. DSM 115978]
MLDSDPLARVGQLTGVAEAVAQARSGVDALLRHKVMRRRSAEVTTEASLRCARASASLDGYDVPLDV